MKIILLVDDEYKVRDIYRRFLMDEGFHVIEASDVNEATHLMIRQVMKGQGEKIDLILLDINMPQFDGADMFDVIQDYDPQAKVIIVSVLPLDEQKRKIPNATEYFDKSDGVELLLDKVKEVTAIH